MSLHGVYCSSLFISVFGCAIASLSSAQVSAPKYTVSVVDATCSPSAIASDANGNIYEACPRFLGASASIIRKITKDGVATTVAGEGPIHS